MPNTSATGGPLAPLGSPAAPAHGIDLEVQLQGIVRDLTGLPGALVRPRWQPTVPKQPEATVTWAAIGVTSVAADTYPAVVHRPAGEGVDVLQQHEVIEALASFYGPASMASASLLRDGLVIFQNREALGAAGLRLLGVGSILVTADLVNQAWVRRHDLTVRLRRQVDRAYAVLNLLSAGGELRSPPDHVQTWTTGA